MASSFETIAKEMSDFAADIADVRVEVDPEDSDEVRMFLVWLSAELPEETAVSLCRGWARLIQKSLPDRRDGWSSSIVVIRPLGSPMGVYFTGWTGREDVWSDASDMAGETDSREWNALYRRLDRYLRGHGRSDSQGRGDYFLFDEDYGVPEQSITIYRIEFLTPDLISEIQEILRSGYSTWSVRIVLDLLPPVQGVTSDGIEIHADRIVENWNRALLIEQLGERLKV